MCANPKCWFLVNEDVTFGGFCCRKCCTQFQDAPDQKTKKHGHLCGKVTAPEDAMRATPQEGLDRIQRALDRAAGVHSRDRLVELEDPSEMYLPGYLVFRDFAGFPEQYCLLCETWADLKHTSSRVHRERIESTRKGGSLHLFDANDHEEWPAQLVDPGNTKEEGRKRSLLVDANAMAVLDARDPLTCLDSSERTPPRPTERLTERVSRIDVFGEPSFYGMPQPTPPTPCAVPRTGTFPSTFSQFGLPSQPLPKSPEQHLRRQRPEPQQRVRQEREGPPFSEFPQPASHQQRLSASQQLLGGVFWQEPSSGPEDAIPWASVRDTPCRSRPSSPSRRPSPTSLQGSFLRKEIMRPSASDVPKWDAELRAGSLGQDLKDLALPFPLRVSERGPQTSARTTPAGALPEPRPGPRMQPRYRDASHDEWWDGWRSVPGCSEMPVRDRWWSWDGWSGVGSDAWAWGRWPDVPSERLPVSQLVPQEGEHVLAPRVKERGEDFDANFCRVQEPHLTAWAPKLCHWEGDRQLVCETALMLIL